MRRHLFVVGVFCMVFCRPVASSSLGYAHSSNPYRRALRLPVRRLPYHGSRKRVGKDVAGLEGQHAVVSRGQPWSAGVISDLWAACQRCHSDRGRAVIGGVRWSRRPARVRWPQPGPGSSTCRRRCCMVAAAVTSLEADDIGSGTFLEDGHTYFWRMRISYSMR